MKRVGYFVCVLAAVWLLVPTGVTSAQTDTEAGWNPGPNVQLTLKIVDSDPTPATLPDLTILKSYLKESREVLMWTLEQASITAQLNLEKANGLPSPTLSGGYKRSEVEDINTFLVGFAISVHYACSQKQLNPHKNKRSLILKLSFKLFTES